jgi:hypothetical protein
LVYQGLVGELEELRGKLLALQQTKGSMDKQDTQMQLDKQKVLRDIEVI